MTGGAGERKAVTAGTGTLRLGRREWLLLLLLGLIWGSSFLFIGLSVPYVPPLTLAALRLVIAAAVLWLVLFAMANAPRVPLASWRPFAAMGLLNNVLPFALIIWSQLHIAAGLAAIIVASTPLFGIAAAAVFLRDEPPSWHGVLGCVAGLSGIVLLVGLESLRGADRQLAGIAACTAGAACFALASVFGRRVGLAAMAPLASATGQVTAAGLVLLPIALMVEQPWKLPAPPGVVLASVAALGVVSTGFAYVLYFRILATAGSTNLLLVNLLVPVPAIGLGAVVLGQALSARHYVALVLIALGLSAVDGRLWRRSRNPAVRASEPPRGE